MPASRKRLKHSPGAHARSRRKAEAFIRAARLKKVHEAFMCLPNTYATFIGAKLTKGKRNKRLAVVCLVAKKILPEYLLPQRRIPKAVSWSEKGRTRRVRTDVVALPPSYERESGFAGPGDRLGSGLVQGTVGVAIEHPVHGDCLTTAGHFVEMAQSPRTVQLDLNGDVVSADVRRVQMTSSMDYAVLKPQAGVPCDNLFADLTRLGPAFEPTFLEIGTRVFVLDRIGANRIPTICRGVNASVSLTEEVLTDCILTDQVTTAGQSGTCLVDDQFRVWGLLRGRLSSQFSVFMPIRHVLNTEGARLLKRQ